MLIVTGKNDGFKRCVFSDSYNSNDGIINVVKPTRPIICLMASEVSLYFFKLFSNNIVLSNSVQLMHRLSKCLS